MRALVATAILLVAPAARADEWLGPDKALHFGVSAALAGGAYQSSAWILDSPRQRAETGAALSLSVGAAKELVDLAGHGDASFKDLAADAAGTATAVAVSVAIDWILRDHESWRHTISTALGG